LLDHGQTHIDGPAQSRLVKEITMRPDKACPVVLAGAELPRLLLFRHPQAGVQLVKGTIERGETPEQAALRELAEESGINAAEIADDLGCWDSDYHGQIWSFQLCQAGGALPEQWSHQTLDDHGHIFEFFWASLDHLPYDDCHPVFRRALVFLCESLKARGHLMEKYF
jgi:8-oxo-dGTP pyrophosphatase MutT (NUDIX family)